MDSNGDQIPTAPGAPAPKMNNTKVSKKSTMRISVVGRMDLAVFINLPDIGFAPLESLIMALLCKMAVSKQALRRTINKRKNKLIFTKITKQSNN